MADPKVQHIPFWFISELQFIRVNKNMIPNFPLISVYFCKQLPDAKSRFAEAARPRELKRLEKELQAQFDSTGELEHTMASIL